MSRACGVAASSVARKRSCLVDRHGLLFLRRLRAHRRLELTATPRRQSTGAVAGRYLKQRPPLGYQRAVGFRLCGWDYNRKAWSNPSSFSQAAHNLTTYGAPLADAALLLAGTTPTIYIDRAPSSCSSSHCPRRLQGLRLQPQRAPRHRQLAGSRNAPLARNNTCLRCTLATT